MGFPSHNIDPKKKDRKWRLDYCKAMWEDAEKNQPHEMFYHARQKYDKISSYARSKQDTTQYKRASHVDEQSNNSTAVLDFKNLPLLKKHRQIILGRLQKSGYFFNVSAVDALAKTETDLKVAELKVKIQMRNELARQNSELANSPQLQPEPGEPQDLEELEIQTQFGYKHQMAIEAEEGIDLVFDRNNIKSLRDQNIESLADFGVTVVKDWMEPDGSVKLRKCDPRAIITNTCRYPDFRDLLFCGEKLDMTWHDFKEESNFSEEEYETIQQKIKGNAYSDSKGSDGKVPVLDIEWYSINEIVREEVVDRFGNKRWAKVNYNNKGKEGFEVKRKVVIYKAKWVIGTDFIYDDGLVPYIKKDKSLSFHIEATNFHEMTASGVTEDLIPIADQAQISWLKLQNIRNQLIPFGWDIDLDAIEDVSLSKGGKALTAKEVIQMWFQNGILLNRRKGLTGQNGSNYKSIEFIQTNYGALIESAWNDFDHHNQLLSQASGFNEITDGSTPNSKNLNSTNAAAIEGTNNALYHIYKAEKNLLLRMAKAVVCRLGRAVKMGKVEGSINIPGGGQKHVVLSDKFAMHEYGMIIEDKPTDEQKAMLLQDIAKAESTGDLDITDRIVITNCRNLKQAEQILAYRIKKRREEKQRQALENTKATVDGQIASAKAAEEEKRQTLILEYGLKTKLEEKKGEIQIAVKKLELDIKDKINIDTLDSKETVAGISKPEETPIPPQVAA